MKKAIVILLQVLGAAACSAQYFHFNNVYYNNTSDTAYSFYHVEIINDFIYAQGTGILDGAYTVSNLKFDMDGQLLDVFNDVPPLLDYASDKLNYLFKNDSTYLICPTRFGSCTNQMPRMRGYNLQNEMLWEKDFAEWEDCSQELYINPQKLLRISDTSFVFISLMRPYQDNPPSKYRFTEMNFEGEILNDYISTSSLWAYFTLTEVYKYNDNYILVGVDVNCGDYDINIIKTDLQGNVLSDTCIGNPNNCGDGSAGTYLNDDGTMQLVYGRCIENFDTQSSTYAMHSMKLNISDWSTVYDYPIAFPEFDNGLLSSGPNFRDFTKDPFGGYIGVFYYYNPFAPTTFPSYAIKIKADGTLDWLNNYAPPSDYYMTLLEDIASTPDGGFAAGGSCSRFEPAFVERAWLLKIDACGYEQPSGCPPTVGVNEFQMSDSKFQIWPNPFHHQLKAVLPQNAQRVFISDAMGRIVFEERVFYPNQTWSLGWLSDGVYMMNVELENGQKIAQRIVKQQSTQK